MALDNTRLLTMVAAVRATRGRESAEKAKELLDYVESEGEPAHAGESTVPSTVFPDAGSTRSE